MVPKHIAKAILRDVLSSGRMETLADLDAALHLCGLPREHRGAALEVAFEILTERMRQVQGHILELQLRMADPCPRCGGTGTISDSVLCPSCQDVAKRAKELSVLLVDMAQWLSRHGFHTSECGIYQQQQRCTCNLDNLLEMAKRYGVV